MALFHETIVNIISNFIINKIMIFYDRDPPWLNKNIKSMFDCKNAIYKKLIHYNDNRLKLHLRYPQDLLIAKIE